MKPIIIEVEKDGKVILDLEKYKKQLDEAYNMGYEDGKSKNYYWWPTVSPTWSSTTGSITGSICTGKSTTVNL